MSIEIERTVAATPDTVLQAIRKSGEWRESRIPSDLKDELVIGIDVKVKDSDFELGYVRKWYPGEQDLLELRGKVLGLADGTTRVNAKCGYNRGLRTALVVIAVIAVGVAFSGGKGIAFVIAFAIVVLANTFIMNTRVERGTDKEANYLVQRLDQALVSLGKVESTAAI